MRSVAFVTAIVLNAAAIELSAGRNIEVPTYDELFARSDFIIIACPVTKTRDTREHTMFTKNISPAISAIGVVTEFKCLHVIKGKGMQRFTLHHYREDRSGQHGIEDAIMNGPFYMSFEPAGNFLMFLVRERDGRFAPVAGQMDPDLSIYKLR
jgi:hypothetical protein